MISALRNERILITRTDRLGDVLLSVPALLAVVDSLPSTLVGFLIRKEWVPLFHALRPQITLIPYEPNGRHKGALGFARLVHDLRRFRAQTSVSLVHHTQIATALLAAQVPIRIGPYSKPSSFLLYNAGVRQRRSRVKKHESEYNLDLVEYVPGVNRNLAKQEVSISPAAIDVADVLLKGAGFQRKNYVVLHFGSSGSSQYLDSNQMVSLLKETVFAGHQVIATGSSLDAALLRELRAHFDQSGSIWWQGIETPVSLDVLASLIAGSTAFFAHSTGPLHLASALRVPTFGVFPSVAVLSPARWGALGPIAKNWQPGPGGSMRDFKSDVFLKFLEEFVK